MYMALTEKDKVNIQKNGFYVIEFKKIVYKLLPYINEFVEYGKRMMKTFSDLADEMRTSIDEIKEGLKSNKSVGYMPVKFYSKVGYNKRNLFVSKKRKWLPRSNC